MKVIVKQNLIYQKNNLKKFFSFKTCFSNNVFLLTNDGYSALINKFDYIKLTLNIKSKKILKSHWFRHFLGPSELEKPVEVKPTFFLIELTNNCNLCCKYCFRGEHTEKVLSSSRLDDILNSILNYVKKYKIDHFSIQPWGGEPTLELEKIIRIREFFDKNNLHPTITCETNGLLLTKNNVEKMIINDIEFGVSVDGIPEVQNYNRPLANGTPSSNILEKNITTLHEKYPKYRLSCITTNTKQSADKVYENLLYLAGSLHFKSIKMNFVKNNPFISNSIETFTENDLGDFYRNLFFSVKKLSKKYPDVREGNISIRVLNLLYHNNSDICNSHGCSGGKRMFAFDVEGNIYNCELIGDKSQLLGTYKDDFIEIVKESMKNNKYFNDKRDTKCHECPYQYFCMGGCGSVCLNEKIKTDVYTCNINKTLYSLIIKDLLRNSKFIKSYKKDNK